MPRGRLIALIVVSLAIPAVLLAIILSTRDDSPTTSGMTPETVVPPYDTSKARVGEPAPQFALDALGGGTVRLSQYRGRPVVLTFFASWCHPCEEELPALEEIHRTYGDRLAVVGVNFRDSPGDSRAFLRRLDVTFPSLREDEVENPVAQRYGVNSPPMTFFIDADGKVAAPPLYGPATRGELTSLARKLTANE